MTSLKITVIIVLLHIMESIKQSNIKNDKDFAPYLQGYSQMTDDADLPALCGARIRYKLQHYNGNQVSTQYRIGGILTHVDNNLDYITLKNVLAASSRNGYRNSWSVQLRFMKIKDSFVPVIPSWRLDSLNDIRQVLKNSPMGCIVLYMWYFKPQPREIQQLHALVNKMQQEEDHKLNKLNNISPSQRKLVKDKSGDSDLSIQRRLTSLPKPSSHVFF